jgi:hypothetical protein
MRKYLPWGKKEIKILKELYPQYQVGSLELKDIAKILGRTIQGVRRKACDLGLPHIDIDTIDYKLYEKIKKELKL